MQMVATSFCSMRTGAQEALRQQTRQRRRVLKLLVFQGVHEAKDCAGLVSWLDAEPGRLARRRKLFAGVLRGADLDGRDGHLGGRDGADCHLGARGRRRSGRGALLRVRGQRSERPE
eukprot:2727687-Pleurochrysis_carterae.AAC.1